MKKYIIITILIIFVLIGIYNNLLTLNPKMAIRLGQNINKVDKEGNTALMNNINNVKNKNLFITTDKRLKNIKTLIELGADVNIKNNEGQTALVLAIKKGALDITKELIKAKANVNIENNYKLTALRYAVEKGDADIVKELVNAGADVNYKHNKGETPLMFAVEQCKNDLINGRKCSDNMQIINLLIEGGSTDKNASKIKNINNLISKQEFLTAAKLSNQQDISINFIMHNQITKNLLDQNKFIEARNIVKDSSLTKEYKDILIRNIDSQEISIIKPMIQTLLNENEFIESRKKVRNSTLSQHEKNKLISKIDSKEISLLEETIDSLLTENKFTEAKKIVNNSSVSKKLKDILINSIERSFLKTTIQSLLDENKFIEARKKVKISSLPQDNKDEFIQEIDSKERSILEPIINNILNENKFIKAREKVKNSSLSQPGKDHFMSTIDSKEMSIIEPIIQSLLNEDKFAEARKKVRKSSLSQYYKNDLLTRINTSYLKHIFQTMINVGEIYGSFMDRNNCTPVRKLENINEYFFPKQMYTTQVHYGNDILTYFTANYLNHKFLLACNGVSVIDPNNKYPSFGYTFNNGEITCLETSHTLECPRLYDYELKNKKYFNDGGYGRTYKYRVKANSYKNCCPSFFKN